MIENNHLLVLVAGGWELAEDVAADAATLLSAGTSEVPRTEAPPNGSSNRDVRNTENTSFQNKQYYMPCQTMVCKK